MVGCRTAHFVPHLWTCGFFEMMGSVFINHPQAGLPTSPFPPTVSPLTSHCFNFITEWLSQDGDQRLCVIKWTLLVPACPWGTNTIKLNQYNQLFIDLTRPWKIREPFVAEAEEGGGLWFLSLVLQHSCTIPSVFLHNGQMILGYFQ